MSPTLVQTTVTYCKLEISNILSHCRKPFTGKKSCLVLLSYNLQLYLQLPRRVMLTDVNLLNYMFLELVYKER